MVRLSRRRITIEEKGRQVVLRGWKVAELAREAGAKPLFVGSVSGWMIDGARLPDLMAVLERRGITGVTDGGVQTAYTPLDEKGVTTADPLVLGSQEKGVQDLRAPAAPDKLQTAVRQPDYSKTGEHVFQSSLWDPTDGGDAA